MADTFSNSAATCDCCSGISQETPHTTVNRPGLNAIAYRVGVFSQFKDTLLARLQLSRHPFLSQLKTRENDDFTIALLDAFSTVADVLTFYTERYQNESYLLTSRERQSVLQLASLIGYQLRPGVAASTYLAFTLDSASGAFGSALTAPTTAQTLPDSPANVVVDVGTRVQSIPGPGEKPQVFETVEAIQARAEWNAIAPRLRQQQEIVAATRTLVLNGAVSNLKPGDKILLLPNNNPLKNFVIQTVLEVDVQTDGKTTLVHLEGWDPNVPGFFPVHYSMNLNSCVAGQLSDIPANSPLNTTTVTTILNKCWDADTLTALANTQKWSLDQLSAALNQQLTLNQTNAPATGTAFVLRQQVATFGHNAPFYNSLQPVLRYDSVFQTGSGNQPIKAAYPSDWEGWTLATRGGTHFIYLDSLYPGILAKSWIVLQTRKRAQVHYAIAQVASNTEVAHTDYTLSAKVSLLRLGQATALNTFSVRKTSILCQSEQLDLAQVPITDWVGGKRIALDRAYVGLRPGQTIVLSGERSDLPGVTVAEICLLTEVVLACGVTVITLKNSLAYTYTRSTVSINANVALGTHGETVQEILGNGDGTQTFQSFLLRQSPLTYISADSPSGIQTTLQIHVNNLLWNEVPFFYGHGPEEKIYITRQDDSANTTVTFGDGVTGSRLPTGPANIIASYRRGIGAAGEVRANQLSMLTSRPLGVRGVNNPLAATGAADPETLDDARQNATLTIQALDRIVSLEDFQSFARAFAGIAKAIATWSWNGEQRVVLLTIAGVNGETIDMQSDLAINLFSAINTFSEPGVTVRLFSFDKKYFAIEGIVTISKDYLIDVVTAQIESTLRGAFSFASRTFGQAAYRSEVIATIQNVPGVVDVDLTAFYRSDNSSSLEDNIPAALPRPGGTDFFAAQLLTLDPAPLGLKETQ